MTNGAACGDADEHLVSTEEELLRTAPLPHERVVYWGSGSPQAWRVLIALEEKGVPYRSVCVSFSSGVLKTPFFRALNPRMRVPVLVEPVEGAVDPAEQAHTANGHTATDDETTSGSTATTENAGVAAISQGMSHLLSFSQQRTIVYESMAILEFLEKKFPKVPCVPASPAQYAIAQLRLHEANEILSVVGDLVVYLRRFPPDKRNPSIVAAKWACVEAELSLWEQYLDSRAFLVDADVAYLCDFTLFTNVAYAVRCGLQLDGLYPRLAMFYVRLCARASVEKTWPPHWKTTFGSKVLTKCFYCSDSATCACDQQPPTSCDGAASPKSSS
ncbi:Glutathione s-transferase a, partial [Globisporangium splendens]